MLKIVSAAAMRELDRATVERCAVPSLLLMETAAHHLLSEIKNRLPSLLMASRFQIFCGAGNNGGDGAALARLLSIHGAQHVNLFLCASFDDTKNDARTNFEIVRNLAALVGNLSFTECPNLSQWQTLQPGLDAPECVVDALFGTGLTRPLDDFHASVVEYINRFYESASKSKPLVVAVDVPSGLVADEADVCRVHVRADVTVTFTTPKIANVMPPAARNNGELVTLSVGTPPALVDESSSQTFLIEHSDAAQWLERTAYVPGSYKNSHGHALVIAGSRDMSGAGLLAAEAAHVGGAGLTTLATPRAAHLAVAAKSGAEIMVAALHDTDDGTVSRTAVTRALELAARADVLLFGCGMSNHPETKNFVHDLINQTALPMVIDADGLNLIAPLPPSNFAANFNRQSEAPVVLTPHEGELRRLLGVQTSETLAHRLEVAREFAGTRRVILVLKGEQVIIAAPDGRIALNPTGNPGTGTAGTGDTLAGIITACLAQEFARFDKIKAGHNTISTAEDSLNRAFETVVAAVYIAGVAADVAARRVGLRAMTASDIRRSLSRAFKALNSQTEIFYC